MTRLDDNLAFFGGLLLLFMSGVFTWVGALGFWEVEGPRAMVFPLAAVFVTLGTVAMGFSVFVIRLAWE